MGSYLELLYVASIVSVDEVGTIQLHPGPIDGNAPFADGVALYAEWAPICGMGGFKCGPPLGTHSQNPQTWWYFCFLF